MILRIREWGGGGYGLLVEASSSTSGTRTYHRGDELPLGLKLVRAENRGENKLPAVLDAKADTVINENMGCWSLNLRPIRSQIYVAVKSLCAGGVGSLFLLHPTASISLLRA